MDLFGQDEQTRNKSHLLRAVLTYSDTHIRIGYHPRPLCDKDWAESILRIRGWRRDTPAFPMSTAKETDNVSCTATHAKRHQGTTSMYQLRQNRCTCKNCACAMAIHQDDHVTISTRPSMNLIHWKCALTMDTTDCSVNHHTFMQIGKANRL